MRNYNLLLLCCIFVMGCAQQKPAPVVAAKPTTYKPLANLKLGESRALKKMQKSNEMLGNWIWPVKGQVLNKFSAKKPRT